MRKPRIAEIGFSKSRGALALAILGAASLVVAGQTVPNTPLSPGSASTSAAPALPLSPIAGELETSLDSKTAKAGDRVVLKTRATVHIAAAREIPKGSKLIGRVLAAQSSSSAAANAQIALEFDQIELKNGEILSVHCAIQALSPSANDAAMAAGDAASPVPSSGGRSPGDMYGSSPSPMASTRIQSAEAAPDHLPAPGTLVGSTGSIALWTTSIPGVLLATDKSPAADSEKSKSSGVLLGVRRDFRLAPGTSLLIGVAPNQETPTHKN